MEFEAVVERAPTNDYALFCLGRALMELGRAAEARKPLALAAQLRPERRDYRIYRERAAKAADGRQPKTRRGFCRAAKAAECYNTHTAFCRPQRPPKSGRSPAFFMMMGTR